MSDTTTAEDRCRGVLIGLAAGDQIGGPIRMAVRLAESLVACGGFNPSDILERYLAWWREGAFDTGPVSDRAFALAGGGDAGPGSLGAGPPGVRRHDGRLQPGAPITAVVHARRHRRK